MKTGRVAALVGVAVLTAFTACWLVRQALVSSDPGPDVRQSETGPVIEVLDLDVGMVPADLAVHESTFRIANRSGQRVRVLNFTTICTANCCVRVQFSGPVDIPPFGEVSFVAEMKVARPEPFEGPLEVYVDSGKLQTISFTIQGQGGGP